MARFGGDATFGLDDFGEADAPGGASNGEGEGFDLDQDAIPDGFNMQGLDDALPGESLSFGSHF